MSSVTVTGIEELVERAVREQIVMRAPVPWLNVKSAAEYLDTTEEAIRSLVKRNALPVHRTPTGRLLFRPEELDAWVEA